MGLILPIVLIVLPMGGFAKRRYGRNWGYGPTGDMGFLMVNVPVLLVAGYIPRGFRGSACCS